MGNLYIVPSARDSNFNTLTFPRELCWYLYYVCFIHSIWRFYINLSYIRVVNRQHWLDIIVRAILCLLVKHNILSISMPRFMWNQHNIQFQELIRISWRFIYVFFLCYKRADRFCLIQYILRVRPIYIPLFIITTWYIHCAIYGSNRYNTCTL